MAKVVLTAEFVTIGSTDLTQYCSGAELSFTAEEKDVTNYQSGGWHELLAGLKQAELKLSFYEDFAAAAFDSIVFPWFGTVQTFEIRATQAARGTSNPAYLGSVLVSQFNPVTGKVGDVDTMDVTWKSTGAVTRAIS